MSFGDQVALGIALVTIGVFLIYTAISRGIGP